MHGSEGGASVMVAPLPLSNHLSMVSHVLKLTVFVFCNRRGRPVCLPFIGELFMNLFNSDIHHRKSIRLKEFDYSQSAYYFVTLCVQNKDYLFGEVVNEEILLNHAGIMIKKWFDEIPNKFKDFETDLFVIMPNHFHCIIANLGADLSVCHNYINDQNPNNQGEHTSSSLRTVIQWFKTMTTNDYIHGVEQKGWKPFNKKLWQRNYYEHIIRNITDYEFVASYILNNPIKWGLNKKFL